MSGPCAWSVDPSCGIDLWNASSPDDQQRAAQFATTVLWASTGRQFGVCTETVRPCLSQNYDTFGVYWSDGTWFPYIYQGNWYNACGCLGMCACNYKIFTTAWLPGPVASVLNVTIDGVVLDPAKYRIDGEQFLVRQDGGVWPSCSDLNLPLGSVGTWSVTLCIGRPVPNPLVVAAGTLAVEFLKACAGQSCRLPGRVTSVVRSGVSVTMVDLDTLFKLGLTGLPEVDILIRSYNPSGLPYRPRIYSPDLDRVTVTTWP